MKSLLSTNIYEHKDILIIAGSCLENMDKEAYEKLKLLTNNPENIYSVCLEEIHMNMVAHKIASILRLNKVKKLIFATVDKSPHCIQLHYIRNELEKIMNLEQVEIKNYISNHGFLIEIPKETIALSKNLLELSKINIK